MMPMTPEQRATLEDVFLALTGRHRPRHGPRMAPRTHLPPRGSGGA